MKIVCEACQAKYSIADDKVRGKVFKIRCKKCSHVIVVRGAGESATATSGEFATSPASATDLTLDAGWHIVVEGEQVGPLSEVDIRGRLARGEISAETYIWKEGLADWVKIATLSEFADGAQAAANGASPAANPFGGEPGGLFAGAPSNGSAPAADVFSSPTGGGGGRAGGDLFAAPMAAASSDNGATAVSLGGGYGGGGYEASLPAASGGGGGLTGQRHENSVLFSLSNLEALAKPSHSQAPLPVARGSAGQAPSAATTTEGSGLIDIRAMANMTLGASSNRSDSRGSDLPAFSAPQFSPVAPVLLAPSSSVPRYFIPAAIVFGLLVIGLAIMSVKLLSRPEAPTVVVAPPVAAPAAGAPGAKAPAGAAAPSAAPAATGTAAAPPATPTPAPTEALPPREPAGDRHAGAGHAPRAGQRIAAGAGKPPRGGAAKGVDDAINRSLQGVQQSPPPRAEAPVKKAPKDDIEALLEAASGGSKKAAARREAEDEPAAKSAEKLPPLAMGEIVKGMNGVLPKARECYAQFKVPGVANAKVTVNSGGKVTGVTVSGKFAGTPSGNCVESAIKSARFAASSGLTFDYPVPLR
jgi:predicted Zn finger-like uncharacterized protein